MGYVSFREGTKQKPSMKIPRYKTTNLPNYHPTIVDLQHRFYVASIESIALNLIRNCASSIKHPWKQTTFGT